MRFSRSLIAFLALVMVPLSPAQQSYSVEKPVGTTAQQLPAYLAHAGVEQRLGQALPMTATFIDELGQSAPLSNWFHDKPVVLALVYYKCAMLCPQVLHGLADGLRQTTLTAGKDYDVIVFSIDPSDSSGDAQHERLGFLSQMGLPADASSTTTGAVHFLTAKAHSIAAIADATGFHYILVPGPDGKMDQFAHSSVIMFATPDGRLSKYLSGVDYPARDLRMALLDASAHKISNPVDLLILYCCSYNPVVGKYSVSVLRILSLAGMFSVVAVIGMLFQITRKPKGHATA